ncbi:hypothetical protein BHE74_00015249 [Ensete ventricosum]|nr:hypothetical protein BHE74_00015249 [Ensete ventricosum]
MPSVGLQIYNVEILLLLASQGHRTADDLSAIGKGNDLGKKAAVGYCLAAIPQPDAILVEVVDDVSTAMEMATELAMITAIVRIAWEDGGRLDSSGEGARAARCQERGSDTKW